MALNATACKALLFLSDATFELGSSKKINISEVLVVVLILGDHLLQKEEEDRRETAVFQEEPSRAVLACYSFAEGIYSSAITVP